MYIQLYWRSLQRAGWRLQKIYIKYERRLPLALRLQMRLAPANSATTYWMGAVGYFRRFVLSSLFKYSHLNTKRQVNPVNDKLINDGTGKILKIFYLHMDIYKAFTHSAVFKIRLILLSETTNRCVRQKKLNLLLSKGQSTVAFLFQFFPNGLSGWQSYFCHYFEYCTDIPNIWKSVQQFPQTGT